jgi:hypothetical protein
MFETVTELHLAAVAFVAASAASVLIYDDLTGQW